MVLLAKRGSPETGQSQSLNGDQSGSQRAFQRTARTPGMDTIKGVGLIAALLGFIVTCAAWIHIWDATWQAAVEPTRAPNLIGPSDCLAPIAWWWKRQAGCRLI